MYASATPTPQDEEDPVLTEMTSYFLGPAKSDVTVETPGSSPPKQQQQVLSTPPSVRRTPEASEPSGLAPRAAPAAAGTGKEPCFPSSDHLKKLRRNERDRQRSFAKRESMKEMRKTVAGLEQHKQRLVEQTATVSVGSPARAQCDAPRSQEARAPTRPSSLYPSPSTPVRRENFVQLAAEIEEFRRQNALMTQQLRERDLFNSSMQNLLLEFRQDDSDSGNSSSSETGKKATKQSPRLAGSGPRPLNGSSGVRFTPLTRDEGLACVRQTLQLINNARLLYASDERFGNRAKFLGWSQYTLRQGTTITFAVKKTLANVTPRQLMDTTWQVLTDSKRVKKLVPSVLQTHIRPLQKLSDDLLVIDRRTEDSSRPGVAGKTLALRTVYVLFRVADADGGQTLAMKTVDLPLVKKLLRDDEFWCDIFYWIRFSPDGSVKARGQGSGDPEDVRTVTEFGGANTYTREEIASSWLAELMFLAIRWETLAVAPTLLKQ
ncbi:hypothetical protein BBJ28_00016407 [Nothophytophthora sp. Chile5]|nr:hypothetical protein BBJ28_00016407 [Nothophytophthora sp. Chile5]